MTITGLLLVTIVSVPPGHWVTDHSQPAHFTQPTVRYFERRAVDEARGNMWNHYVDVLDRLWADYRNAGSTQAAWERYKRAASAARRCYVYQDPYLLAQIYRYVECDEAWCAGCPEAKCCRGEYEGGTASGGATCCGGDCRNHRGNSVHDGRSGCCCTQSAYAVSAPVASSSAGSARAAPSMVGD